MHHGYNAGMRMLAVTLCVLLLSSCDLIASTKLEAAVKKALGEDPRTASSSFEVSHQGEGEMLITGEVMNGEVRAAVTEIAQAVEGVTSVLNRCIVPDNSGGGMIQDTVVNTPYF